MRNSFAIFFAIAFSTAALAQNALKLPQEERKDRQDRVVAKEQNKIAQRANVEFRGNTAFDEKELRSQLKEQIATIEQYGLSAARGDDVGFFLELFYRKHGYAKVAVAYRIEGDRLRLDINEGPLTTLGEVRFVGNDHVPASKLLDYAVGPTRERYSKAQKKLPYVAADLQSGVDLVQRYYVAQGFTDCLIDPPVSTFLSAELVNVTVRIHEGRQYFFGNINFAGPNIYGAEALRGQMLDLLNQPYTEGRLADIPRRMQTYFKTRGYYGVKADAVGDPKLAIGGKVPVLVTINPGPVYYFDGVTVKGTRQLRPSYLEKRFQRLSGKPYSPETLDKKFRELMRTSLFSILQVNPTPVDGNKLRLDITLEEAKPQEFGFSLGYGSYSGLLAGIQYSNRDLFGFGRPITTSAEYSQRGYKADVAYEDPYLFDTEFALKVRLSALTFQFDGYSKFEVGARVGISRKIGDKYEVGVVLGSRHVEITNADIDPLLIGQTNYFVNSIGLTQTLDLRKNPFVAPRGLIIDNTVDLASSGLGSNIDFVRSTVRASYYIQFAPDLLPQETEDLKKSSFQRWFQRSSLAFGARSGIIVPLSRGGASESLAIPIDERFFTGGSSTVRSFVERDLGPHDNGGHPIGGEFYATFNAEYTFPIYGELLGAVFLDAGNLLPEASQAGLNDLRYGVGVGLRYNLPIGPVRFDYGINPNPRVDEAIGAFHFSFGFAF